MTTIPFVSIKTVLTSLMNNEKFLLDKKNVSIPGMNLFFYRKICRHVLKLILYYLK